MIKIYIEEGAALDALSILEIKAKYSSEKLHDQFIKEREELFYIIAKGIGNKKARKIYASQEYQDLFDINEKIYKIIDLAKSQKKKVYFEDVDALNNERFLAGKKIQEKFFEKETKERKLGS